MSMPNPGKCARALGPAKRIAGMCGSKSWGPSRVPGQLAKLQVSSLAKCESQVCLGRTLKASPKFTTQISILAFVPPSKVLAGFFLRNSPKVHRQQFSGRGRSSFPFSSICSFPRKNVQKVGGYHTKKLRRRQLLPPCRDGYLRTAEKSIHGIYLPLYGSGFIFDSIWRFGESMNDLNGKLLLPPLGAWAIRSRSLLRSANKKARL